jgi:hypothetical protein
MDLPHTHANIVIYRKKISKVADGKIHPVVRANNAFSFSFI